MLNTFEKISDPSHHCNTYSQHSFLDDLESILNVSLKLSPFDHQSAVETLYAKLKTIQKFILQFHFFNQKIRCSGQKNFYFDQHSVFFHLHQTGLQQIKIAHTITLEDFKNFIELLQTISNKQLIETQNLNLDHYGIYFHKLHPLTFKDCLQKKSNQFQCLNRFKNTPKNLPSFLFALKAEPDSPQLRQDLEIVLITLIKQHHFLEATQLIEMYTQEYFNLNASSSLWTPRLLTKALHHLKFFKVQTNEEHLECLLNTLPIQLFKIMYKNLSQFQLHPNKKVFLRALAQIHRGDTGFLEKGLLLHRYPNNRLLKKMLFDLFYFIEKPMSPDFIVELSQQVTQPKLNHMAYKLIKQLQHPAAYTWLIGNLESLHFNTQKIVLKQLKDLKLKDIAQTLIQTKLIQTDFIKRPNHQKELYYEACLNNAPQLFLEFIQKNRLEKNVLFKIKYMPDFQCLEKTLKKNQYFSNSHSLKKIQRISRSFIKEFLHKRFFKMPVNSLHNRQKQEDT